MLWGREGHRPQPSSFLLDPVPKVKLKIHGPAHFATDLAPRETATGCVSHPRVDAPAGGDSGNSDVCLQQGGVSFVLPAQDFDSFCHKDELSTGLVTV